MTESAGLAAARWESLLRALAIPDEILAAAPESPWAFPPSVFRRRVDQIMSSEQTPSHVRAMEALPKKGTVLDVGVGAGASSLPLAGKASLIVGVDPSEKMLEEFRDAGKHWGASTESVLGEWPAVAAEVGQADVVVCHHVPYNVLNLPPFLDELDRHARRRVVVEITREHPLAWMDDLWLRFHSLKRPDGPSADDAEAVIRELGYEARREDFQVIGGGGFATKQEAVAFVRRRLCLTPARDPEIVEALGARLERRRGGWAAGPAQRELVAIWWDTNPDNG